MGKKKIIKAAMKVGAELLFSDKAQKAFCGTYSDGTTRSLKDAINDEIISPSDRETWELMKLTKKGYISPNVLMDNVSKLSDVPKDILREVDKKKGKKKKKKKKKSQKVDIYRF